MCFVIRKIQDAPGFNEKYASTSKSKQAGTGPSRRHIKGSKIAKGIQSAEVLVNWVPLGFFFEKRSHNAEKFLLYPLVIRKIIRMKTSKIWI